MSEREATCDERIASQMASRSEDVRKMLAVQGGETKVCRHCGRAIHNVGAEFDWADEEDATICDAPSAHEYGFHQVDDDYHEDSLYEFGLGISRKVVLRFDMSTGGPADWLEILCDEETASVPDGHRGLPMGLTVERVTYHFSDWFDHAEEVVAENTPLYELAEWVAETQAP